MKMKVEKEEEVDKPAKWSVTYTKHIKQKRKVYQDGFLEIHSSIGKATLFDDSEKLLECKFLKDEELLILAPGETLSFNSYLVDLGDLEVPDRGCDLKGPPQKKGTETTKVIRRQKFRSPTVSSANNNITETLSPSQRIIREFRKSQMMSYAAVQVKSEDSVKPSASEWQVLYTTHVTQKAKKYHDGFLRLATCGSHGIQVMLYDESKKLLASRFLKKEEIIGSGESISFDGYLVDIGDPVGGSRPLKEQLQNRQDGSGKPKTTHGQEGFAKSCISTEREWLVMYTTQMTQKAKRYHDGFLRLIQRGSLGRQIMLYDTGRRLLDSRFLKQHEILRSGESMAFDAHLVDIGEVNEENQHAEDPDAQVKEDFCIGKAGAVNEHQIFVEANKSVVEGNKQDAIYITQVTDSVSISSMEKFDISKVSNKRPLRDASQILSILQKPNKQEKTVSDSRDRDIIAPPSRKAWLNDSSSNKDLAEDSAIGGSLQLNDRICTNVIISASDHTIGSDKLTDLGISTENSTFGGCQPSNETEAGKLYQCHLDRVEDGIKICDKDVGFHTTSLASDNRRLVPVHYDQGSTSFEQIKSSKEMDECPSFDLGY